jgi:hypothetical protein
MRENGITMMPFFKKMPLGLRFLRNWYFNKNLPFRYLWINIPQNINDYELIIVGDQNPDFLKYIEKKVTNRTTKLVLYYWNPLKNKQPFAVSKRWEAWSFDKNDCEKYALKYNPAPYFMSKIEEHKIVYDTIFVGFDKGRELIVRKLEEDLEKQGLKTYFKIIHNDKERLSYNEILTLIAQSKAIVEIVQEGQSGITQRAMESVFLDKKLITNNINIKNYDFYNSENIFIWNKNNTAQIAKFIHSPYKKVDENIVNQYTFSAWVERFYE